MFHVGDDPMRIGYDRVEDAYTPMYSEDQLSCYCDAENTCPYHRGKVRGAPITEADYWDSLPNDAGIDHELIAEIKADVDAWFDSELWSARWEARSNGGW